MKQTRLERKPIRTCALLMALCCLFLSSFGSLLHTDELPFASAKTSAAETTTSSVSQSTMQHSRIRENKAAPRHHHCAVCDWQANLLSPALPILTIVPPSHRPVRLVTTLPRAPGTAPVFASSRAPPAFS